MRCVRFLVVVLPALLAACGKSDCECDACETAIDACDKGDTSCEDDALALCDDTGS